MRRFLTILMACLVTTGVAAPVRAAALTGENLLVNPAAEVGACTTSGYDAMTVPGWSVINGSPDSVCYGSIGFPKVGSIGPHDAGRALFSGGATGDAVMSQSIDLTSAAREINIGEADYDLSGWLGGFAGQDDRVAVGVEFFDRGGDVLATDALSPVTNTDRSGITKLIARHASGGIPIGARTATVTLTFRWTSGDTTDGYADDLSFATDVPVEGARLAVPSHDLVPAFDHVFFVFMENENFAPSHGGDYIVANPRAPYLNGVLAFDGALLSGMYATTHPSDPNYLAVTGGSTFGRTTNPVPGTDMIHAPNLGDALEAAGKTWRGYAEGMAYNCDLTSHNTAGGDYYLPDDEPFMLYADVVTDPDRCAAHNQPLDQLATDLDSARTTPSFVWFAANDVNDMEDGGVAIGDDWLRRMLPQIFGSPAWTTQRSLLIVSWDEGHTKAFGPGYDNHVPTYVLASQGMVKAGFVSKLRYTDYSLGATIEDALGIAPLTSNDRYASPLTDVWTTSGAAGGEPGSLS
jgi:hypothetical protein